MRQLMVLLHEAWVRVWLMLARVGDTCRWLHFYQPLPDLGLGKRFATARVIGRWEAIRDNLPTGRLSGLDVGCNVGFYSFEMAKLGHQMWGCEASKPLFLAFFYARERLRTPGVHPCLIKLTPHNIAQLPKFDCVICMAVFHHWCFHFGTEAALVMLDTLIDKTHRVLFFETAQTDETSERYRQVLPEMGDDPERWLHEYFLQRGCRSVRTIHSKGRHLVAVYR